MGQSREFWNLSARERMWPKTLEDSPRALAKSDGC
jgi:hypothetical protein